MRVCLFSRGIISEGKCMKTLLEKIQATRIYEAASLTNVDYKVQFSYV